MARLRKKELWAAFAEGLSDGDTVKRAAARCGVAGSTSFRLRHRFLAAVKAGSIKLETTKYLDSYLAWYHLAILPKLPTPRSMLASVAGFTPVGQPLSMANPN